LGLRGEDRPRHQTVDHDRDRNQDYVPEYEPPVLYQDSDKALQIIQQYSFRLEKAEVRIRNHEGGIRNFILHNSSFILPADFILPVIIVKKLVKSIIEVRSMN
jgi:hypothetical protein